MKKTDFDKKAWRYTHEDEPTQLTIVCGYVYFIIQNKNKIYENAKNAPGYHRLFVEGFTRDMERDVDALCYWRLILELLKEAEEGTLINGWDLDLTNYSKDAIL